MNRSIKTPSRNGHWRIQALPAAIMLGLLASTPAMAAHDAASGLQTTRPDRAASAANPGGQTDTTAKKTDNHSRKNARTLGTVEVTATGRLQRIIAVPYNIDAVSGSTIEKDHIQDNAELFRSIPGVNVVDAGPRNSSVVSTIRMRGVNVDSSALGDYALTSANPVATYVDSVPLFVNFLLFDINRVEVLKGPQGTLYGSGSLGGTVRYLLNKPQLNKFSGSASASLSSVKYSSGIGNSESVVLNVPLGNTLALRLNGKHNDFPGATDYVDLYQLDANGNPVAPGGLLSYDTRYTSKKDADTVKQNYGRASLLWKPNDRFSAQLSYLAQADRFGARRGESLGTDGFGRAFERNELGAAQLEPSTRHVHLTDLELNVDLGFATLTSSTSQYDHEGSITSDNTGFYAQNQWYANLYYNYPRPMSTAIRGYGDKAFTQELRLVSETGGTFDYIVGAYYHRQKTRTGQISVLHNFKEWWDVAFPAFKSSVVGDEDYNYVARGKYREVALYGQGTWHVTDALQFTLGMRTFRDRYTSDQDEVAGVYASVRFPTSTKVTQDNHKTLFLGNMSWWFNDSNQFYATVSEGYRRGGTTGVPITGYFAEDPSWMSYKPDTVLNYELGFKGMGSNFTYTADVFDTKWKNPQLNTSTTNWGFFAVQNMGRAESKGVELELQGHVGDHFDYGLGYTYTDAKLTRDAYSADGVFLINTKGTRLPGVSKHHLNASGSYNIQAGPGLLTFHADASYQSSAENSISASPKFAYTLPGFTIWNAVVSYNMPHWTASLWLKNIGNARGATGIYTQAYMGSDPAQHVYANGSKLLTTTPRTIGATFTWRF